MIQVYRNGKWNTQEQHSKADAVNMMINELPDSIDRIRISVYDIW